MSYKQITFRSAAREKLVTGTKALADTIKVTLGPKSKSVLIDRKWGLPLICDDGVTIAKETRLKDPEADLGVRMLRQAAEKTGELVGDGTSTSTILAHRIFSDGVRNVVAGASAVDIRRGLDQGLSVAVDALRELTRPVSSRTEKAQVAKISAHNDPAIGELVADAMDTVGDEGAITVEDSRTTDTVLEVVEGMQFDRGYISPYFVTDVEGLKAELEGARVLLHDRKLSNLRPLIPLLEAVMQQGFPLLIVAEDVTEEALATLVVNRLRGGLKVVAVKAPGFGDRRRAMLEDIAVLTGAQLVSEELGVTLENVDIGMLGSVSRVVSTKDTTTLVGGAGDKADIEKRTQQIRAQIDDTTSDYDQEKLEERLAKLSGGVAVIRVGAASEAEVSSRKEALDDALNATKAAVAEGIVPGGGLALLRCVPHVERLIEEAEGDVRTGLQILRDAFTSPARQIAENSAIDGGVVVARMMASEGAEGFDAAQNRYVDLFEAGIVDPTKVVRTALQNAVSVAGTLLLTEATMTEIEETPARVPDHPMEAI